MWTEENQAGLGLRGETAPPGNLLLRALPWHDLKLLDRFLHSVPLTQRRVLQHAGFPIEYVYFIEEGLVSALAKADDCDAVEVGLIGRDGIVGNTVILGAQTSTFCYFVQIGGSALRIGVEDLNRVLPELPRLRQALQGYMHLSLVQSAQTAACSLRHPCEQRLASWLLMARDRSDKDQLLITQDLLARSLGVRRPTVSEALKSLQQRGVFVKDRGWIRILDRAGLERIACRCYRTMCRYGDAWKRSTAGRKTIAALSLICTLFEIEAAVQ